MAGLWMFSLAPDTRHLTRIPRIPYPEFPPDTRHLAPATLFPSPVSRVPALCPYIAG